LQGTKTGGGSRISTLLNLDKRTNPYALKLSKKLKIGKGRQRRRRRSKDTRKKEEEKGILGITSQHPNTA
jgi:hypothetical protein